MTNWQQQPQQTPQNWQMPQQAPHQGTLPGPGVRDYFVRLTGFGDSVPSPREVAALTAADVVEPRVQNLLVWRRTLLIFAIPFLLLSLILSICRAVDYSTGGSADFDTGIGMFLTWISPILFLVLLLGATIAAVRWVEAGKMTRILFWSWVVATAVPLIAALVPMSRQFDFDKLGEAQFESIYGYEADIVGSSGLRVRSGCEALEVGHHNM
ncbi:hypothetical protein [uncultured Corynebacterium sp.]|uniref:hypothetical protein n=1 Tax=uncultured Corynebacterium sp. TaxID=159447 RepID=UPI0025E14ED7|nr:hypothetical protein [uncultured Corynebacterium sp.]